MRVNGIEVTGQEIRVIIKFPSGLRYVGEILNHNGDYGLVVHRDNEDQTTLVYFGHNDMYWIDNDDLEEWEI